MQLDQLPALGQPLAGGIFAGIITRPNGDHCAVVLLPGYGTEMTWPIAKAWAEVQGGELPSRPVAALLFANCKPRLQPRWHWTNEEYDASSAWGCGFYTGTQYLARKSFEGSAVAVRYIRIGGSNG